MAVTASSMGTTQKIWNTEQENMHGKERGFKGEQKEDKAIDYYQGVSTWEGNSVQGPQCLF